MKRNWDQYFISPEYAEKEAELANLKPEDVVLEIGAGSGVLTRALSKRCKVIAVEPDSSLAAGIELRNVLVINKSFFDLPPIQYSKVVSNPPYSQSQKILVSVLQKPFDLAVFCFAREFAAKLSSYSKLGKLATHFSLVSFQNVPASAFVPHAVSSRIVVIRQRHVLEKDYWLFLSRLWRSRNRNVAKLVKNSGAFASRKLSSLTSEELYELWKKSTDPL